MRLSFSLVAAVAAAGALALAACGNSSSTTLVAPPGTPDGGDPFGDLEAGTGSDGAKPDPTPGCGATDVKKGLTSRSLMADGSKRTYDLFVPDTYDSTKSFPLVFVLHGD